jgi:hypothetical protein
MLFALYAKIGLALFQIRIIIKIIPKKNYGDAEWFYRKCEICGLPQEKQYRNWRRYCMWMKYMLYGRNADCMPFDALLTLAAYYGVPPRKLYKGAYFPTLFS